MKYKPGPDAPEQGQRIDGQAWSAAGPGATVRGWVWPRMAFRPHFLRVDAEARRLDEVYEGMTEGEKEAWEDWAAEHVGMARCANEPEEPIVGGKVRVYGLSTGWLEEDHWYDIDPPAGIALDGWTKATVGEINWWASLEEDEAEGSVIIDFKFSDDSIIEEAMGWDINFYQVYTPPSIAVNEQYGHKRWHVFTEEEQAKTLKAVRFKTIKEEGLYLNAMIPLELWLIGGVEYEYGVIEY